MRPAAVHAPGTFFSPFETGHRPCSGWRWYWRFLREYPDMMRKVEADCFTILQLVRC
jgi:hypothetical protein